MSSPPPPGWPRGSGSRSEEGGIMRTEVCLFRNVKCGIATVIITAESRAASVDTPHPANTQVSVPLFSRSEGTLTCPLHVPPVPALRGLPAESPAARGSRNPGVHERRASPGKRPLGDGLHCLSSVGFTCLGTRPPRAAPAPPGLASFLL